MTTRNGSSSRHLRAENLAGRRWRGLVRESTEQQADKWSPERQRDDLRRSAIELGMIPVEPLFYERVGSGEAEDVPELAHALADGKAGQYDVLVVLATSRFARNRAEAVRMKAEFRRAGIVIYFVAQRLISGTYAGGLTEGIHEVIDEQENETRRFWIAGGQRQRQMAGRWTGVVPFGYRKRMVDRPDGSRGWDGVIEPNPAEAPTVRLMFDRAVQGVGTKGIAVECNARGLRTAKGNLWRESRVRELLTNPAYAGRLVRYRFRIGRHYYDHDADDGHADLGQHFDPVVEPRLFDDAQLALEQRRTTMLHGEARTYPLSKMLRCKACGHPMTGCFRRRRYYRCIGRTVYATCEAPGIRADDAEDAFAAWLGAHELPEDWREEIARSTAVVSRTGERDRRVTIEARLKRLRDLYSWGDIPEAEYRAQAEELRSQMGVIALPSIGSLEAVAAALANLGSAWRSAPAEMQAAIPPLVLRSAEVVDGRVTTWVVRGELKPLLDLCRPKAAVQERIRFSA